MKTFFFFFFFEEQHLRRAETAKKTSGLQKKERSSFGSERVERECGRKDIVFGWFCLRLRPLSSEHWKRECLAAFWVSSKAIHSKRKKRTIYFKSHCRGGVFKDVLGLEDILGETIWSPWPRMSYPWPRSLQVLENAPSSARVQQYFLTCWKWAKVMTNCVSSWRTPESLRKSFWRFFFSWRTLELSGKFTKFWIEDLFFLEITSALCPWSLALASNIPVLGLEWVRPQKGCLWPWPRAFCPPLHLCHIALILVFPWLLV